MELIYEQIRNNQERLENTNVLNTSYTLMDYLHGRCHIFAQALYEELYYKMQFMWDIDYWFENAEYPSIVLVHAYCIYPKEVLFKDKYVDARGSVSKKMIEYEYEFNCQHYEDYSLKQLKAAYKEGLLEEPTEEELNTVRRYIRENIKDYQ